MAYTDAMQRSVIILVIIATSLLAACASDTTSIKVGGYTRTEGGR